MRHLGEQSAIQRRAPAAARFTQHCGALLLGLAAWMVTAPATAQLHPEATARRVRPYVDYVYATVDAESEREVSQIWKSAEHVLAPHDPHPARHEVLLKRATLKKLQALGLRVKIERVNVQALVDAAYDKPKASPRAYQLNVFDSWFSEVQTLSAIESRLKQLTARAALRTELVELGKSIENRPIWALRVSSAARGADRPSIVVVGTQHAREWASPMVTMGIADALVNQYETSAEVRKVVDHLEIYVIPVVNPDGYVATHNGDRMQRKNSIPVAMST